MEIIEQKICSCCKQSKDKSEFPKEKINVDGLNRWCRTCHKNHRIKTKDHRIELRRKRRENPEYRKRENEIERLRLKKHADYYKEKTILDAPRLRFNRLKYKKNNKGKTNAHTAKRHAAKMQRTPKWLTEDHLNEIKQFYIDAVELAWLNNGEIFHVDHVVPLQGENVSGLHVPWNLQLLPELINVNKGNKF